MSLRLEFRHLDGIYGTLVPLVPEPSTTAVLCLLQVVCGEKTIDDGDVLCGVEVCNAVCDTLADVVEMRGFAPDDTSEDDDGVESVICWAP